MNFELPDVEAQQLKALVRDHGIEGAIAYLRPLKWNNPNRNQALADKHRAVLESIR